MKATTLMLSVIRGRFAMALFGAALLSHAGFGVAASAAPSAAAGADVTSFPQVPAGIAHFDGQEKFVFFNAPNGARHVNATASIGSPEIDEAEQAA